jgi:hypothetical protein
MNVTPQVQYSKPSRHEENSASTECAEPCRFKQSSQAAGGEGFFHPVGIPAESVPEMNQQGTQERIELVRHTHDGDTGGLKHAKKLPDRSRGVLKVLYGSHRVEQVECVRWERQSPNIGDCQQGPVSCEPLPSLTHDFEGQVNPCRARTLFRQPQQDLAVLCLVPEIAFQNQKILYRGEELLAEETFALEVISG